jgi:hypothetical protein
MKKNGTSFYNWQKYESYVVSQIDQREEDGTYHEPVACEENETGRVWSF